MAMELGTLVALDARLTTRLQRLAFGRLDCVVLPGAVLFGWKGIVPVLMTLLVLTGSPCFYLATLSLALGQVLNRCLKIGLRRARPKFPEGVARFVGVKVPGLDDPDGASFPSGDSMASSAVGAALAAAGFGSIWRILGLYTAFGRVFFWCHFLSDVLAGYVVGAFSVALVGSLTHQGHDLEWYHLALATMPFLAIMKALKELNRRIHDRDNRAS